jgi:hypothetical protein
MSNKTSWDQAIPCISFCCQLITNLEAVIKLTGKVLSKLFKTLLLLSIRPQAILEGDHR